VKLSPQQLQTFEQDGFLLLRNFAPLSLCEEILEAAKEEIRQMKPPIETEEEYLGVPQGSKTTLRRLRQVYYRHPVFAKWMHNDDIRPILQQVLKERPILTLAHHNSIMTKMPETSTETCWHQDIRYWRFDSSNLVSVWLALGEERIENGLLEFIPGSHKLRLDPEQFDAKVCFREDTEENQKLIAQKVHYDLNPGDIVIFHALTLHHAWQNRTDKPKISFVYTVRGESVSALPDTRSAEGEEKPL
jgi:phytanoyl-CoA hydroxylase